MAKKAEKPKLRLLVKKVEVDHYYFTVKHNNKQAKKMCDPSKFRLAQVTGVNNTFGIPGCRFHYLNGFGPYTQEVILADYDFYCATKKEILEAKEAEKIRAREQVDYNVDNF